VYHFRVTSRNEVGYSLGPSDLTEIYAATYPYKMDKVTLVIVVPDAYESTIEVAWVDNPHDGGSPIIGYYLQVNNGFGSPFVEPGTDILFGTNSFEVPDLIAGATYNFRIAAYNLLEADNSFDDDELRFSETTTLIAANVPDKITDFSQSLFDYVTGEVHLEWVAPANNGSPITSYTVTRDVGSGVFFVVHEGQDTFFFDLGLTRGDTYNYKVKATNVIGESEESDVLVTTASEIPGKILTLFIVLESQDALTIGYAAPPQTGDMPLTKYLVVSDDSNFVMGTPEDNGLDLTFTKAITQPGSEGKIYRFRVAVENAFGVGPYSDEI